MDAAHATVSTYTDAELGDLRVCPVLGNVVFGSGLHQWGFTLRQFARTYAAKLGTTCAKVARRIWGDSFYKKVRLAFPCPVNAIVLVFQTYQFYLYNIMTLSSANGKAYQLIPAWMSWCGRINGTVACVSNSLFIECFNVTSTSSLRLHIIILFCPSCAVLLSEQDSGKWTRFSDGGNNKRGFCAFVLDPIMQLIRVVIGYQVW